MSTPVRPLAHAAGEWLMQLVVEYPDVLPDALRVSRLEFEREARMAMAVKLFELVA